MQFREALPLIKPNPDNFSLSKVLTILLQVYWVLAVCLFHGFTHQILQHLLLSLGK